MKVANRSLAVRYREISELKPYARNARVHTKKQIRKVAASIKKFGFTNPVLLNEEDMIVAGHGRVEAAKSLNMAEVPTIALAGLSEDDIRAYILADNQLALEAEWNPEILRIELQHLVELGDGFDITLTGFEIPQIDQIIFGKTPSAQESVRLELGPNVTRSGDLWRLGRHTLLCGSALSPEDLELLMGGAKADVVFTDPPYNVPIDGHVCGNGSIRHQDFAMASGEMTEEEFTVFLQKCFNLLSRHSRPGSVQFVCIDWRHLSEMLEAGKQVYESLLNLCVWSKGTGGMGSLYRSQHELVLVFRNPGGQHRNNIQLGKWGRSRTNVWEYPGVNCSSRGRKQENLLALHPTVKPTALVADALLDVSAPNEVVLDGFVGSGSTLLAAERTSRICHGLDISPQYIDVAIRRWQRETGGKAILASTGQSFDELAVEREEHDA